MLSCQHSFIPLTAAGDIISVNVGEASPPPTAMKNWPCRWAREHLICINALPLWLCDMHPAQAWLGAGYTLFLSVLSGSFRDCCLSQVHLSTFIIWTHETQSARLPSSFCMITVFSSKSLETRNYLYHCFWSFCRSRQSLLYYFSASCSPGKAMRLRWTRATVKCGCTLLP